MNCHKQNFLAEGIAAKSHSAAESCLG